MTLRKKSPEMIGDIEIRADRIYRTTLSPVIFGYGPTRTKDLMKEGKLPLAAPLSEGSTCEAWTGQQILDHRARMRELAAANLEIKRAAPKQAQPEGLVGKAKKFKLRPPTQRRSRRTVEATS